MDVIPKASKRSERRARGRAVAKIVTSVGKASWTVHVRPRGFTFIAFSKVEPSRGPSTSVPVYFCPDTLFPACRQALPARPPPLAHVPARPTPGCYLPSSVMPASARGYTPCSLFASSEPSRRNLPQYRSARQGSTTTTPPPSRNGKTPLSLSSIFSIQGRFRRNFIISRRTDKFAFSFSF